MIEVPNKSWVWHYLAMHMRLYDWFNVSVAIWDALLFDKNLVCQNLQYTVKL